MISLRTSRSRTSWLTLTDLTSSGGTREAVYSNSGLIRTTKGSATISRRVRGKKTHRYMGLVRFSLLLQTIVAAGFSA